MNYNPYAAPQAGGPPPAGAPFQARADGRQPWEIGEVLGLAWKLFGDHWVVLLFSLLVPGVAALVPIVGLFAYMGLNGIKPEGIEMQVGSLVLGVFTLLMMSFFQVGLVRIWIGVARGETPDFGVLFSGGDRYLAVLALRAVFQVPSWLVALLMLAATAMESTAAILALKGVQVLIAIVLVALSALGLFYAEFVAVDEKVGPIASIKRAWTVTGEERGKIFLFALAAIGIFFASAMCCGLPVLVASPVLFVGAAIVYTRMTGTGRPGAAPPAAYGGNQPPPGAGYGAPPAGGYGAPPGY